MLLNILIEIGYYAYFISFVTSDDSDMGDDKDHNICHALKLTNPLTKRCSTRVYLACCPIRFLFLCTSNT